MDAAVLILVAIAALAAVGALVVATRLARRVEALPGEVAGDREGHHRAVLTDIASGLADSADRIASRQSEEGDRLRRAVGDELARNREQLQAFERSLQEKVDKRLDEIGGKVSERLDEGFKRTNETFVSVMTRLQTIDDAQKKIDALTTNVVNLHEPARRQELARRLRRAPARGHREERPARGRRSSSSTSSRPRATSAPTAC